MFVLDGHHKTGMKNPSGENKKGKGKTCCQRVLIGKGPKSRTQRKDEGFKFKFPYGIALIKKNKTNRNLENNI